MFYEVSDPEPYFGLLETGHLSDQAKMVDMVCVSDFMTGERDYIKPDSLKEVVVGRSLTNVDGWTVNEENPVYAYAELCHVAAAIRSNKQSQDKLMKDHIFSVSVCDGYAQYVVLGVNRMYCEVQWRCFNNFDRYVDPMFDYGGRFRKRDVEPYRNRSYGDVGTLMQTFEKMFNLYKMNYGVEPFRRFLV